MNADNKKALVLSAFIGVYRRPKFFSSAPALSFDRSSSMEGFRKSGSLVFFRR
jgi:hypothetical protein